MNQLSMGTKLSGHRYYMPTLPSGLQALLPLIWSWILLSLSPVYLILFAPVCIGLAGLGLNTLAQDINSETPSRGRRFFGIFLIAASIGGAIAGAVMKFHPLGILIAESVLTFSLGMHFIIEAYGYFKTPKEERTPLMKSNLITSGIKNLFQLGILAASICLFLIPGINFAVGIAVLATAFLYGTGFGSWEEERRRKLILKEFDSKSTNQKQNEYAITAKDSFTKEPKSNLQKEKYEQVSSNPHLFYATSLDRKPIDPAYTTPANLNKGCIIITSINK